MSAALAALESPTHAAVESGEAGITVLHYKERGLMKVTEPVVWARARIGDGWEVQGSAAIDIVSGASPEGVSDLSGRPVQVVSGASVTDRRHLGDIKVGRRFGELTVSVSRAFSEEEDYRSHAHGIEGKLDLNDRNTTLVAAYGQSNDRVGSSDDPALDERRDTREYLVGITQVVSPVAVVQSTLAWTQGRGWYNDPYKYTRTLPFFMPDTRPASRETLAWLTRYRHHVPDARGTLQADYRFYRDDWAVRAHTLDVAWEQSMGPVWALRPGVRYHTQRAARFYGITVPRDPPEHLSSDPRLAAFGGVSLSLRAIGRFANGVTLEATVGNVRNASSLRLEGQGSPAYETLRAWYGIVSVSRSF